MVMAAVVWSLIGFWTPIFHFMNMSSESMFVVIILSRIVMGAFQGLQKKKMTECLFIFTCSLILVLAIIRSPSPFLLNDLISHLHTTRTLSLHKWPIQTRGPCRSLSSSSLTSLKTLFMSLQFACFFQVFIIPACQVYYVLVLQNQIEA